MEGGGRGEGGIVGNVFLGVGVRRGQKEGERGGKEWEKGNERMMGGRRI